MEKFLFKKISLWFVLLLFVLGVTSSVIFSSMVRHVVKGGTLLGQWTDIVDDISKFPGKIITLARSNSTKIDPQISDTNLYSWLYTNVYQSIFGNNFGNLMFALSFTLFI